MKQNKPLILKDTELMALSSAEKKELKERIQLAIDKIKGMKYS
ncbi:MAG: hypothetical protein ACI4V5_08330 [Prevotella sp.]